MPSISGSAPLRAHSLHATPSEESRRRKGRKSVLSPWCDPKTLQLSERQRQIVIDHLPMIDSLATSYHRKVRRFRDIDDLRQSAYLGLHQAGLAYDEAKSPSFAPYAATRIRWAMFQTASQDNFYGRDQIRACSISDHAYGESLSHEECLADPKSQDPADQIDGEKNARADPIEMLRRFLPAIPQPSREMLQLRFIGGLNVYEIARRLGLNRDTANARFRRACRVLRDTVELNRSLGNSATITPILGSRRECRYFSDQLPGREFSPCELVAFLGVSMSTIRRAMRANLPIGKEGYIFHVRRLGATRGPAETTTTNQEENEMDTKKEIPIDVIRLDGGTQIRVGLNEKYVAELMESLAGLPAPTVMFDGAAYWLADGFHRYAAHLAAKRKKITCLVRHGSKRDAVKYGLQANAKHGLRRSSQDKRKAVETCLADSEWSKLSDREIAEMTATSHTFVSNLRRLRGRRRDRSKSEKPFPFIRFKQLCEERVLQLIPREEIKDCELVIGIRFADGRHSLHPVFGRR